MTAAAGLVDRLGGRDGLRRLLVPFYQRLAVDPMLAHHFAGRDLDAIVDGQLAFLLKAFGATAEFTGRHPSVAHRDLAPILAGQFDRRHKILADLLDRWNVPTHVRDEWLGLDASLRPLVLNLGAIRRDQLLEEE